MPELCFVMSSAQNWFFAEIVESLREELRVLGIATSRSTDGFPAARDDLAYALLPPHEYAALRGEAALPRGEVLARTIFICAEQPESVHFEQNVRIIRNRPPGAVFDINPRAIKLFEQRGVNARHLPLGYTSAWDRFDAGAERDIDVTFLASQTVRRLEYLRVAAPILSRRRCELRISDNSRPNTGASASFVVGEQKLSLLTRSRVLLNIHRTDEPYFEWLRIMEAIHCGAAVVSEHSTDFAPLVAGEHFLAGRPEVLPLLVDALLDDEPRRRQMTQTAYELLRNQLPMRAAAGLLGATVGELTARPRPPVSPWQEPSFRPPEPTPNRLVPMPQAAGAASTREQSLIRRNLRNLRLETIQLRRRLTRIEAVQLSPDHTPPPATRVVMATAGWRGATPRVSAVIPLHNQGGFIIEALDSLIASVNPRQLELVIVNDASTDGGDRVVRDWMAHHRSNAALLVEHPVNRGLPAARNTGIDFARGRFCLMLDADNSVYPRCVSTLADVLDWSTDLAFAYCMLECFGQVRGYVDSGGTPVINQLGWEPARLRDGNFVDAMALIRKTVLVDVGKYVLDSRTYGYEDYDLWCSIAERGWSGLQIPEILGRYRTSTSSMASLMDLSITDSVAAIVERHPRLMQGVRVPT